MHPPSIFQFLTKIRSNVSDTSAEICFCPTVLTLLPVSSYSCILIQFNINARIQNFNVNLFYRSQIPHYLIIKIQLKESQKSRFQKILCKYPIHFLKCHLIYRALFIIRNNILKLLNTPTYLFLSGIFTILKQVAKYLVIHELISVQSQITNSKNLLRMTHI